MAKTKPEKDLRNREFTDLSEETRSEILSTEETTTEETKAVVKKTYQYTYMIGFEFPETGTINIDSEALLESPKVIDKILIERPFLKKMRHQIRIIHHCQINKNEIHGGGEI